MVQLHLEEPSALKEAVSLFTVIEDSIYANKQLGSSGQLEVMTCECGNPIYEAKHKHSKDHPTPNGRAVKETRSKRSKASNDNEDLCGPDSNCINRLTYMECYDEYCCDTNCSNRRFQNHEHSKLDIFHAGKKGYGVRAMEDIPEGAFIYEYTGEVLDEQRFQRRQQKYDREGVKHFYFMMLQKDEFIDATGKGSIARFCNHSCNPNAQIEKWVVGPKLRMGLFAKRDIQRGEEICFDYKVDRYGSKAQPCFCGEPNCSGFLGGRTQTGGTLLPPSVVEGLGLDSDTALSWLENALQKLKIFVNEREQDLESVLSNENGVSPQQEKQKGRLQRNKENQVQNVDQSQSQSQSQSQYQNQSQSVGRRLRKRLNQDQDQSQEQNLDQSQEQSPAPSPSLNLNQSLNQNQEQSPGRSPSPNLDQSPSPSRDQNPSPSENQRLGKSRDQSPNLKKNQSLSPEQKPDVELSHSQSQNPGQQSKQSQNEVGSQKKRRSRSKSQVADLIALLDAQPSSLNENSRAAQQFLFDLFPSNALDSTQLPEFMRILMQSQDRGWLIALMLKRVFISADHHTKLEILRMHGYEIMATVLHRWRDDPRVIQIGIRVLKQWPTVTKNKISSSQIEAVIGGFRDSFEGEIRADAISLLDEWSGLSMGYRIPRRKVASVSPSPPPQQQPNQQQDDLEISSALQSNNGNVLSANDAEPGQKSPPVNTDSLRKSRNRVLPTGWETRTSSNGKVYYYNLRLNITSWDPPKDPRDAEREERIRQKKLEEERQRQQAIQQERQRQATEIQRIINESMNQSTVGSGAATTAAASSDTHPVTAASAKGTAPNSLSSSTRSDSPAHRKKQPTLEFVLAAYVPKLVFVYVDALGRDRCKRHARDVVHILAKKEEAKGTNPENFEMTQDRKQKIKSFVKEYMGKVSSRYHKKSIQEHDGDVTSTKKIKKTGQSL